VLVVGGWVAGMSAACMAIVLPVLASLENFGNAPEGDRIDYHLGTVAGLAIVRGGHVFEMLGLPGMLAVLAVPLLAWRLRDRPAPFGIVSGGLFALLSFCFVPPLFQLLRATGSLTLLLRINHAIGVLLIVAFAALVLELADWVLARGWSHRRRQVWGAVVIVAMMAVGVVLGYDRFMTDWPGYVAWVGLVVVLVAAVVRPTAADSTEVVADDHVAAVDRALRDDFSEEDTNDLVTAVDGRGAASGRAVACRGLVASTAVVLTLGLLLPVGAISVRRALENRDDFVAASDGLAQGDLRCLGGPVLDALQGVPDGSVVLSDPVASFRAMAIAPVYVVGDYKVWNAATSDNRAEERLASINRFFDSSLLDQERFAILQDQGVDYVLLDLQDGRWLDAEHRDSPSTNAIERAWAGLDSFADVQAYDGGNTARLLGRAGDAFEQVAVDDRADESAIPERTPDVDAPCNSYALWRVDRDGTTTSTTVPAALADVRDPSGGIEAR
jgi:hypothetical protein